MGIQRISYLDLTEEQRRKGAAEARKRLRNLLANPFLPADQMYNLQQQMERIDQWEQGTVDTSKRAKGLG